MAEMKKGKQCPACKQVNVPGAFQCGECGANLDSVEIDQYDAEKFEIKQVPLLSSHDDNTELKYESGYKAAHGVSKLIEVAGWLVVVAGSAMLIASLSTGIMLAMVPGIQVIIAGFILVMGAQVTRSTVDNADHTREILKLLKSKITEGDGK